MVLKGVILVHNAKSGQMVLKGVNWVQYAKQTIIFKVSWKGVDWVHDNKIRSNGLDRSVQFIPFKTIWPNFIIVYPIDSFQDHMTWFLVFHRKDPYLVIDTSQNLCCFFFFFFFLHFHWKSKKMRRFYLICIKCVQFPAFSWEYAHSMQIRWKCMYFHENAYERPLPTQVIH